MWTILDKIPYSILSVIAVFMILAPFKPMPHVMDNSRLVYSTETGKICPTCQKPLSKCTCKKKKSKSQPNIAIDGIIRVQREVKGRKGKTVTTVSVFEINADELKNLAAQLKRRCGTGGSVKDGVIIIQGDHRDTLITELNARGFKAKISGG
jgi:translation initiation factor 1